MPPQAREALSLLHESFCLVKSQLPNDKSYHDKAGPKIIHKVDTGSIKRRPETREISTAYIGSTLVQSPGAVHLAQPSRDSIGTTEREGERRRGKEYFHMTLCTTCL